MLQVIKDVLKITWDDEDTRILESIENGKAYLQAYTGTTLDFERPGLARDLLINFCRLDYNNAREYFPKLFDEDLQALKWQEAVKDWEAKQDAENPE